MAQTFSYIFKSNNINAFNTATLVSKITNDPELSSFGFVSIDASIENEITITFANNLFDNYYYANTLTWLCRIIFDNDDINEFNRINNYSIRIIKQANTVPDASHDANALFAIGSLWFINGSDVYICLDNTINVAQWVKIQTGSEGAQGPQGTTSLG